MDLVIAHVDRIFVPPEYNHIWSTNCAILMLVSTVECVGDYWGWWKPARSYHHTGPVSTFYALREALAIVGEEGLQNMWDRHLMVSAGPKHMHAAARLWLHVLIYSCQL